MALIACPECTATVSDLASFCPKCGGLLNKAIIDSIRDFRKKRLELLKAENAPVPLLCNSWIVLHLVPYYAFLREKKFDVSFLCKNRGHKELLEPIYSSGRLIRYNFDGLLSFSRSAKQGLAQTYLQIFRNGSIEAVEASILAEKSKIIASVTFEQQLIEALPRFLRIQKNLGVSLPVVGMLTLVDVKNYKMAVNPRRFPNPAEEDLHRIDRDVLLGPEFSVDNFECSAREVMKPTLDIVWNASGWESSMI